MSVLDLIGLQRIFHDGKEMFRRKNLNFIGGTVTDNPKTDSTDISIGEGGGGGGAVASVFGRTGAVVAVLGDYTSSLINNASAVTGATVTIALNSLNAAISSLTTTVTGKVSGPASAGDGVVSLFSGTTGKVIKTSLVSINGSGDISTPGLVDGRDVSADGAKLDGIPAGGGGGGGPAAPTAPPPAVAASSAIGTAGKYATEDHTHGHGDLAGGTLHAPVVAGGAAGFMTGGDKTKLDSVASGSAAVTSSAPANVTKAAAAAGTATDAARADHKHDVSTATAGAVTIGATAAEGTSTSLARADHVHAVSGAAPVATGTANAAGSAATFARSDHVHQTLVTSSAPTTSDAAAAAVGTALEPARADHKHAVSVAVPVAVGAANSAGVANSLARSDHVHDASAKADTNFGIVNNAAASLTLAASHAGKLIVCTYTVTEPIIVIPQDSTLNLPLGFTCSVVMGVHSESWCNIKSEVASGSYGIPARHAGAYTDTGSTPYVTRGSQFVPVTLVKLAADSWLVTGHET